MKPAWDQLGDEYSGSSSVVIGDADCTSSGKSLCDANDVRGYPTIKYFTAEGPQDYSGGRSYDQLKEFVSENLEAKCLKDNTEGCTDKEKEFMTKWSEKTADEVKAQLTRLQGMTGNSMKADLKKWLTQRIAILKQL